MASRLTERSSNTPLRHLSLFAASALGVSLFLCLALPIVTLLMMSSPSALAEALQHPLVMPSVWLSLRTTSVSLFIVLLTGTPLAWWLARSSARQKKFIAPLIELPIVIPPAVVGVALLDAFGRQGLLQPILPADSLLPFTTSAVILAQVIVSAPFYVQSAAAAFREVNVDLLLVARTLGASPTRTFFMITIPSALPGLMSGAALSWARAMGEFGATLLFAGSLPGVTQTMPLAIFTALESDLDVARAIALLLAAIALLALGSLKALPLLWRWSKLKLVDRPSREETR